MFKVLHRGSEMAVSAFTLQYTATLPLIIRQNSKRQWIREEEVFALFKLLNNVPTPVCGNQISIARTRSLGLHGLKKKYSSRMNVAKEDEERQFSGPRSYHIIKKAGIWEACIQERSYRPSQHQLRLYWRVCTRSLSFHSYGHSDSEEESTGLSRSEAASTLRHKEA